MKGSCRGGSRTRANSRKRAADSGYSASTIYSQPFTIPADQSLTGSGSDIPTCECVGVAVDAPNIMDSGTITIRGAREHNLQNVQLDLPKDKLIVFTGVSGSGKSSLAFDTLYAEGQRRYVESLSAYARQFLGQLQKPDVDYLAGLSPS